MRLRGSILCALGVAACAGDGQRNASATAQDTLLPVNGTELFVHREGTGDAIIAIHGGPLLDHGYMLEPLQPLADEHTLIFYDQRLSGRSAGSVDSSSVRIAAFSEDVEGIRTALGIDRIHVLGHSWGGLIAMRYALDHPDRVRSLILVSPMPPTTRLWQQEEQALRESLTPDDTAGMGALRASDRITAGEPAAIQELLRLSFRSQLHDPGHAQRLEFEIPADYGERSRQFGRMIGDLMGYDLLAELHTLDVPVLIIYGASESGAEGGIDALRSVLPHATVVRMSATGHFAFVERPEEFVSAVRGFLRR